MPSCSDPTASSHAGNEKEGHSRSNPQKITDSAGKQIPFAFFSADLDPDYQGPVYHGMCRGGQYILAVVQNQ